MNTTHEKPVSLRKFAKMTGTSDGGVRKFIAKYPSSCSIVYGKILPSVASIEWGKAIGVNWVLTNDGDWELSTSLPGATTIAEAEEFGDSVITGSNHSEPEPFRKISLKHVVIELSPEEVAIVDEQPVYTGDEDVINDPEDAADFMRGIPEGTSKIEADRLYSVYRARKTKRELQKLEGELVDKGLVYKNLYEFAATMRENFINIPDRVIDNVRASDSRHEAIKILTDEINSVLMSLAGVGEIKLTDE